MGTKPKVYVETTVVSDATALPTRDLVQADRERSGVKFVHFEPRRVEPAMA